MKHVLETISSLLQRRDEGQRVFDPRARQMRLPHWVEPVESLYIELWAKEEQLTELQRKLAASQANYQTVRVALEEGANEIKRLAWQLAQRPGEDAMVDYLLAASERMTAAARKAENEEIARKLIATGVFDEEQRWAELNQQLDGTSLLNNAIGFNADELPPLDDLPDDFEWREDQ